MIYFFNGRCVCDGENIQRWVCFFWNSWLYFVACWLPSSSQEKIQVLFHWVLCSQNCQLHNIHVFSNLPVAFLRLSRMGSGATRSPLKTPRKVLLFSVATGLKRCRVIHTYTHIHTLREIERDQCRRSSVIEVRRFHRMIPGVVESGCVYWSWLTSAQAIVSVATERLIEVTAECLALLLSVWCDPIESTEPSILGFSIFCRNMKKKFSKHLNLKHFEGKRTKMPRIFNHKNVCYSSVTRKKQSYFDFYIKSSYILWKYKLDMGSWQNHLCALWCYIAKM